MKRLPVLLLLLITGSWCAAQNMSVNEKNFTDSLESVLRYAASDSIRARAHFSLSEYWSVKDTVKSVQNLEKGKQYIHNNPFLLALSYFYEARTLAKSHPEKSQADFMKADTLLSPFKTREAYTYRARAWYSYGAIGQGKDENKAFADIILNKAIPLAQQSGDQTEVGKNFLALALVFKNAAQYDKATTYLLEAIETFRNGHSPDLELGTAWHTLAENYSLSGQNAKARPALDSAWKFLAAYPDSEPVLDYYAAEGMYFTLEGKYKNALSSLDKGIQLARKKGLRYDEQRLQMQQFYAYFNDNNFVKAKEMATLLMQQEEMMRLAGNRVQLFYGMALTCENLHEMGPAYQWMKRYSELSDSISQSRLKNDVHAMEIKYRNAEKQQEINALKAKNTQETLSARNARLVNWLLGAAILILAVILLFALFVYRSKKKLLAQKELSHRQQLHEIEQQQQLQFSQAVIQGEEQERRRLARDLHDGLGGMLAGAKINLSAQMEETSSPDQRLELEKVTRQLDHSVTELRRIAHNMMPVNLLKFGLKTALKDLCESLISDTTHISFQDLGFEESLREEVQIHIYRIVQELLSNAVRHANATNIILQCSQHEHIFFITQEDNGKGFDLQAAANKKGIGLSNIRNRVGFLKGKMDIDSVVNEGTTINIELHVD
ncbi:sensor histidine kinase [Chitinophaga arvensicola]|uniref:histidine kinase n=1 Tax=Chitinophaga arvensicola TaxID=29529 RepID=A0A1I0S6T0_9BACT|nr:histidine kinase [Chitinophaga arvensicola]SEW51341.1 Signal transduction histidine kinase [Chitinophaga arvensicola]